MTKWPDDPMTKWPDDPMTKGPDDPMTKWPDGPMTKWPDGPMTKWPDKSVPRFLAFRLRHLFAAVRQPVNSTQQDSGGRHQARSFERTR